MENKKLLIVEDDPGLQQQMKWCFEGIEVFTASDAREAEPILRREQPQVVTLDLGLPPDPGGASIGFKLLTLVAEVLPRSKVIVITGREDRENALRSIELGAYDFFQKPIDSDPLTFVVERAFRLWELEEENRCLAEKRLHEQRKHIVTADAAMLQLLQKAERVATTDVSVLILGETGTGKELLAQTLHDASERRDGPFIVINCGAIPENLLESELFGHEKGAFTGAIGRKIGKIEAANRGTLFLDEIGDMPLPLQVKILRFLENRSIERVGSTSSIAVDVRVVSATHRKLEEMLSEGSFREDLYFRISEITFKLPALRERKGDAEMLARAFAAEQAPERNFTLSPLSIKALNEWQWPGNVRELRNRVKRACIMAESNVLSPTDLELTVETESSGELDDLNLKSVRSAAEKGAIVKALDRSGSNISQAARLLGISRPTLYNLMQKFGLWDGPDGK